MTVSSPSTSRSGRNGIDVHAHYLPDFYREALFEAGLTGPDGIRALPTWSAAGALELMDGLGIRQAVLSVSSPGVHFAGPAKAVTLARQVNEEGRRLSDAHPERFGFFASLPLPDVDASLIEAAYALDVLKADGIVVETNHHGLYLGDPKLEPLYAELDRRRCVIFVHPTSPACSCGVRLDALYPRPMLEFMFESTRSITDMVLSGVLERYTNLRVIVPHAGAALPVLTERIELLLPMLGAASDPVPSMRAAMRRLHFDLAGAPVSELLRALLHVADHSRIHYGSDYPYTPQAICEALVCRIEETPLLDDALRTKIWRENALALFPRLCLPGEVAPER